MYKSQGFSLIELVITLAVLAVLSSMMLTFSGAFLQDNRMSSANNDLVASINLARSAAVSRGQRASICSSADGFTCTNTAWENGWIVFTDSGTAGVIDGNDQILKVSNNAGIDISVTNLSGYMQFKPEGMIASVCVNCFDKTFSQRLGDIFVAAIKNLSPLSDAVASGTSGTSGSSGSSGGHSGEITQTCVAPTSEVTGDSGDSGNSGHESTSSFDLQRYSDYALNVLEQVSPIASAYASGESGISGDSNDTSTTTVSATCNDGPGTSQAALPPTDFLICDSSRTAEKGKRIYVTSVGRIARSGVWCD